MSRIAEIQKEALQELKKASSRDYPDRSSEEWRKVRLDGVDILSRTADSFRTSIYYSSEFGAPRTSFQALPAAKDSPEQYEKSGIEILQENSTAWQEHRLWLLDRARKKKDPFELTNLAYSEPLALRIKKDGALRIQYSADNGGLYLPSLYIETAPGVELDLIVEYNDSSTHADGAMWSSSSSLVAGANSRIRVMDIRQHEEMGFHFHRWDFLENRDSQIHYCVIHSGGLTGKGFVRARALDRGAHFRGVGLYTAKAAQFHDMEMEVSHEADHCDSTLLYKTVLKDRAHSVFNGSLLAPPHIKQVNSHQTNNNIVLSKKARAESMPRLIIQSEDVSCEHGATVGDLDEEALFFLQCRGVPLEQARRMLIEGFMEEILSELRMDEQDLEAIRDQMFPVLNTEAQ